MARGSYLIKKLIQIFRDKRIITGIKITRVPIMDMKLFNRDVPMNKNEITKAATAKAIPTA